MSHNLDVPGAPRRPGPLPAGGDERHGWDDAYAEQKRELRARNASLFSEAEALAKQHGMQLLRHTDWHYQLIGQNNGIIDLWPSTGKWRAVPHRYAPNRKRATYPDIRLPAGWTVLDAVKAAIVVRPAVRCNRSWGRAEPD
jgi:hypothetical protein